MVGRVGTRGEDKGGLVWLQAGRGSDSNTKTKHWQGPRAQWLAMDGGGCARMVTSGWVLRRLVQGGRSRRGMGGVDYQDKTTDTAGDCVQRSLERGSAEPGEGSRVAGCE
jgi:hypothetical protein